MNRQRTTDREFIDEFSAPVTEGNWFRDLNPVSVVLILTCLVAVATFSRGYVAAAIVCVLFPVLALLAGVGRSFIPLYLKLWLGVGLILFILRAAFIPGEQVLWVFGPIIVTQEGVDDGLRFALVVMAMCGGLTLFFAAMPMKKLMLALELRGVSPRATYVVLASFQAIVDLGKNATTVMEAQKSRGIETDGSFLRRIKAFFPILAPVFLAAMNQTEERAVAMDARAFNSTAKHTQLLMLRKVHPGEVVAVVVVILLAAALITGSAASWF